MLLWSSAQLAHLENGVEVHQKLVYNKEQIASFRPHLFLYLFFFFIFRSLSSSVTLSASAHLTYIASPPTPDPPVAA